ncbi:mannose-ethanolamine phosphotransferase gpi13 [Aspergillus luchuensis]|uniref:GPI ethanolamine phosphate transferase 3 n=1 Tax=Aspergillus kawachii TaxID=1069201 RepID=A0A146FKB9_ASPKA|nr:mannose-ethanolamine phosphotransferase gpi13 [Aspergillus luchuensis]BCS01147.1 mannose-ethanolamine phosphotransferase gpi13 [Aspergillus luchuensis]GAA82922.1 GPI ethanolamine phosphate transferase 3 [Aspergillus luchuensis IFO 4308]GAT25899.1 GPI ethanolamine phosphate transferase 3 [Aspergillus luchuensis]
MGPSTTSSSSSSRWHLPLFFLYILLLHTTGLYLFTKGFLLTRQTLDLKSNCSHPPIPISITTNTTTTCWTPPTFSKAIILLIDALRYDFTIPTTNNKTYHNALTTLHTTALTTPHNALLYPFIADPPTTTLQRLKALTTGTLPTFIEAGSNFAGSAVTEDNLISQLHDAGKRLVLLGDDTWMKLFPGYFDPTLSRPYESFLVEDLHTVDDGVYEHLVPLLKGKNEEWDVIIAHFLGVDHVGHRFGPGHESMREKLVQMDGVIREVMERVDDETLLVVMGDHGMDENGNHGGEAADEVRAALWLYSTREVWGVVDGDDGDGDVTVVVGRDMPQVDLASTLALLMGVPVPFSNLGRPIEEAFVGRDGRDWRRLVEVNALVGAQIQRFTVEYQRYGWEGVVGWDRWVDGEVDFGDDEALREYYQRLRGYQGWMLEGYKRMWAQFDPLKMVEGLVVLLLSVVVLVCPQVDGRSGFMKWSGMVVGIVMGVVAVVGHVALTDFAQGSLTDGVILGAALGSVVWNMCPTGLTILRRCFPGGVWSWQAVMFTLLLGIGFASNSYTIWEDRVVLVFLSTFGLCTLGASSHAKGVREASFSVIFMLLSRVVSLSRACREEQLPFCRTSFYRLESSWAWQLSSPVITAVAVLYITRLALRDCAAGNLFWFGLGIPSALLLTTVFNALETASNNGWLAEFLSDDTSKTVRMTVARIVLVIVFIGLATAYTNTPRHGPLERPLIFTTAILLTGILSSTPTGGLSLAILCYQLISLRHLIPSNSSIKPTIAALLGTLHFFSTGHNVTLSSIQWKSAYIPFRDTQYPWSPLLVTINTFAAPIVAACAVPLLHSGKNQSQARFLAIHSTVYTVWAVFTALWACILRRHLMLFAIFCPRFLMAGALLVIVDALALMYSVLLTTEAGLRVERSNINSSI